MLASRRILCGLSGLRGGHAAGMHRRSIHATRIAAINADLLKGVNVDHKLECAKILDKAERAATEWAVEVTDFYPPPVIADATTFLKQLAEVVAVPWGGYPQAERCRCIATRAACCAAC